MKLSTQVVGLVFVGFALVFEAQYAGFGFSSASVYARFGFWFSFISAFILYMGDSVA